MDKMLQAIVKHFGVCEIEKNGVWMPLNNDYINNNYDIKTEGRVKFENDLDYGKIGEFWADDALSNGTIEVKTERDNGLPTQWLTTGNIAIEIRGRDGRKSGISITEADTWIQLLSIDGVVKGGFVFKVADLKKRMKELHANGNARLVMGGDDNATQMVLLPIDKLFRD